MNFFPQDTLQVFEFDKIREHVANLCRTPSGKKIAVALFPVMNREDLHENLYQAEEYRNILQQHSYFPDIYFEDFSGEMNLLFVAGSMLAEDQFDLLRMAASMGNSVTRFLNEHRQLYPWLQKLVVGIEISPVPGELINSIIDSDKTVKSNASAELSRIRTQLDQNKRDAEKRFRSLIQSLRKKGYLRDHEENFYHDRRVLAVLSEHKHNVPGIVHGKSDTGRTTFIEPMETVELNNGIAELEEDERYEINRLLRELTDQLRPFGELFRHFFKLLSQLDFIRAKASFALELSAILPLWSKYSEVRLLEAVHPLLFLHNKNSGKTTIPLSIHLDNKQRMILISGPNAGGKSIALKTLGLLQIMYQCGLLIPCKEGSVMCFFNHLLADIGDAQSIEYELSTYSSRLIRMKQFLKTADIRTLVLIDEFGTGTDPELGGALAEVVLEELAVRKSFGIITTHYTNLKLCADKLEGVTNASMLFDPRTLLPKYVLLVGQPGSSYTFEVAEKIGFPSELIGRSRLKVQKEKVQLNSLLVSLQEERNRLHEKIRSTKDLELQMQTVIDKYEQLAKKLEERVKEDTVSREELKNLLQLGRKLNGLMSEWGKTKDRKQVIKRFVGLMTAEKKKSDAENTPEKIIQRRQKHVEKMKRELFVGAKVRVMKSKQSGVVEKIGKKDVVVNFGAMKLTVGLDQLDFAEDLKMNQESRLKTAAVK